MTKRFNKRPDLYKCSEDDLLDYYTFNLEELANAIKIRDAEAVNHCMVNGKLLTEALRRRNLFTVNTQTGRN